MARTYLVEIMDDTGDAPRNMLAARRAKETWPEPDYAKPRMPWAGAVGPLRDAAAKGRR
jgi:hypothetical protein